MEAPQYNSLFAHGYTVIKSDGNDSRSVDHAYLHHQDIDKYLVDMLGEDCEIDSSQAFEVSGTAYEPQSAEDCETRYTTLTLDYIREHSDGTTKHMSQVLRWYLDQQFELLAYNLARVLWCQTTHPEWTEGAIRQALDNIAVITTLLSISYDLMHMFSWFPKWSVEGLDKWLTQFQFNQLTGGDKMLEKMVFQIKEVTVDTGRNADKVSD